MKRHAIITGAVAAVTTIATAAALPTLALAQDGKSTEQLAQHGAAQRIATVGAANAKQAGLGGALVDALGKTGTRILGAVMVALAHAQQFADHFHRQRQGVFFDHVHAPVRFSAIEQRTRDLLDAGGKLFHHARRERLVDQPAQPCMGRAVGVEDDPELNRLARAVLSGDVRDGAEVTVDVDPDSGALTLR